MQNFERPKHYAFKPTIEVKMVPAGPVSQQDMDKINALLEKYSDPMFYDGPYIPSSSTCASDSTSGHVTMVSTPVYL